MIAMQYSFTLPADYDMAIIDRRIRDKGPMLDGFPRLRFKAYLSAKKEDADLTSAENLYAPFYLWDEPEGIDSFLSGAGFETLTRDFGWPSVQTWLIWQTKLGPDLSAARYAIRTIETIAPYANLAELRERADAKAQSAMQAGALAAIVGFDPTAWRQLLFSLWPKVPVAAEVAQIYTVGHVSQPR
ncbi:hypothetical protein DL1_01465 [Thioclava dalianensis]|uniref:D-amino acid aminotransferase n=1 Tax=Thioclava dalianensis TaxID=1185766 RepID=A0A074TJ23_9RHOB|nr:DUF4865 family protein [Thioclava dalianensis]KEP71701.1 hypothetical protein DL1_01465 [Thioclava dalianensis]SFN40713.1 protein of unknown function [Thioclava dalianensis]